MGALARRWLWLLPACIAVGLVLLAPHAREAYAANGSWTARYFNNTTLTGGGVLNRDDGPNLDFFWEGSPGPGVNADFFSVRWTRTDTYTAGTYRFTATSDDGMRVFVDNVKILDMWRDQPPTTFFVDYALTAGSHTVRVEYYDAVNAATAKLTIVDVATLPPGWQAEYFANQNLTPPAGLTRNDGADINFEWGEGAPAPGWPIDNFSVRWTRTLDFNEGVYQFTATSDDGSRVYVDGQLILDFWVDQGPTDHTANKQMSAGPHTVVVEYYDSGGGATMILGIVFRPDLGGFVTDTVVSGEPTSEDGAGPGTCSDGIDNGSSGGADAADVDCVTIFTTFAFAPDGRMFLADKDGSIWIYESGAFKNAAYYTVSPVATAGDRGVIGLALDPAFASNGFVYIAYTYDSNPASQNGPKTAQIIRVNAATPSGNVAVTGSKLVLLGSVVGTPAKPSCEDWPLTADCMPSDHLSHSVGALKFGPDGKLYAALGDGASYATVDSRALRSIDVDRLAGKILRIDPATGLGLPDNPFYNGNASATRSKVFALGMRNPFRFNFKPGSNLIVGGDVGWDAWEEINKITPGVNLGWPCYEGTGQQPGYAAFPECQALYAAGTATPPMYTYPHPPDAAAVGGAFTGVNGYSSQFQNTFFWADYPRSQISVMKLDGAGNLVPGSVDVFTSSADGPVQVEIGPEGDIYYLSIFANQVRRIRYVGDNRPPVAVASGTPLAGALPLNVTFSSAGSADPDAGQTLTYQWNFGDGTPVSNAANPSHVYSVAGTYTATLTVTDPLFLTDSKSVQVQAGNEPPTATITSPAAGSGYDVGDVITLSGSGDDPQDGALPPGSLLWTVTLRHCDDGTFTNCHDHPGTPFPGAGGSVPTEDHGDYTFYEIALRATDSGGLQSTQVRNIMPNRVDLTFNSSPPGMLLTVDSTQQAAPFVRSVPKGSAHTLFAPSPQGGLPFAGWSDAGAQQHQVIANAAATFTASFAAATPTPTPSPTAISTDTPSPTATPTPTPTGTSTTQASPVTLEASLLPPGGAAPLSTQLQLTIGGANGAPVDYVVRWGDGTLAEHGTLLPPGTVVTLPHAYTAPGSYTLIAQASNNIDTTDSAELVVGVLPLTDGDGDAMPDGYESARPCLDSVVADAAGDPDADGALSGAEYASGTNPCAPDTDNDACPDGAEAGPQRQQGGQRDGTDRWDFFDVQVPAIWSGSTTGVRSGNVTIADVLGVVFYIGTRAGGPASLNAVDYDDDLNADGTPDGVFYDRSPALDVGQPWRSGPPSGSVTIADALSALIQVGDNCR